MGAAVLFTCPVAGHAETIDAILFSDSGGLAAHSVRIDAGETVQGAAGQTALRLNPRDGGWRGGLASFRLKVRPDALTYLTIRLWGGEASSGRLVLLCDGKQVGDAHLGGLEQLDIGAVAPQFPGAFFYRTLLLPAAVTKGRQTVDCAIEATGNIWPYGLAFDRFQRAMTAPSRGVYGLFTHDGAYFDPPAGIDDGKLAVAGKRPGPGRIGPKMAGAETLSAIRQRIEGTVRGLLTATRPLGQHEIVFLARFRLKSWSPLAKDPRIVPAILKGMDGFAVAYAADPMVVRNEKSTWNPDWFGFGPLGQTLVLGQDVLKPFLDEEIGWRSGTRAPRRVAYLEMLTASRDWFRQHRRLYANQSMIVDTFGLYLANRGIGVLDPAKALPEDQARRYLYEAIGIEPWRGADLPDGKPSYAQSLSSNGTAVPVVGTDFRTVTRMGLTRELGYVGHYGEVLDWVSWAYDATRPTFDAPGDPKILARLSALARARGVFRYPAADDEGFAAMRMMTDIGWRDPKSPGAVTYLQDLRPGAASPFQAAVLTRDPTLIGYAQQMIADNQLWGPIRAQMQDKSFRSTYGLLDVIDDFAAMISVPDQAAKLPMSVSAPDFAFADPENGVVTIKRGEERVFASLYWRANMGINGLARVWTSGPRGHRIATVAVDTAFTPSGSTWVRPDKVALMYNDAINKAYGRSSAEAGSSLPIAAAPAGVKVTPGRDSFYAGRGDRYVLNYGGYTVVMNMSDSKPATFVVPPHDGSELVSGRAMPAGGRVRLEPLSSMIFFKSN
ncbi:hypothetical protein ACFSC3_08120 [Sphingomonas floccifaciens]|uniref:Uncharacterized protein n=2 Tax=Sphingomonas floccifaciens TaxID=1844115 RepID=A0ABW4NFH5_9SPHN